MDSRLVFPIPVLLGFLLTLVRVAGAFTFVPLPGIRAGFESARVVLSVTVAIALFSSWPQVRADVSPVIFLIWVVSEAVLGIGIGLAASFISESLAVGAQVMGLQAGYAYASTIDPSSQSDSTVLVVLAQLVAGLLFLGLGLDREVLRIFARSLETVPPGSFTVTKGVAGQLLACGGLMFSTGIRLALPVIAILLAVDIALALLGRVNSHLQMLSLAFPIKMLVALTVLGWVLVIAPGLFRADSVTALGVAAALVRK
jgi:flagellar biosynthesis protein FliR